MEATTITPPARTDAQRRVALEKANRIRSARAVLKVQLKKGEVSPDELLEDLPVCAESMKVMDFLTTLPKIGRVKASMRLHQAGISPSRTLSGLTMRQRRHLLACTVHAVR
jgi:hypothetical protein